MREWSECPVPPKPFPPPVRYRPGVGEGVRGKEETVCRSETDIGQVDL